MARPRGIKQRHPLGSVASRTGISPLSVVAASSVTTSDGVKISELPAASAANDGDQLETNQSGTSRRVTVDQLAERIASSEWIEDAATPSQPNVVHATQFGATFDGVTDDTLSLQAFLDAIPEHGMGVMPPGTAIFTATLTVGGDDKALVGAGSHATVLKYAGASTTIDLMYFRDPVDWENAVRRWNLQNFRITSDTDMTAGAALHLHNMLNSILFGIIIDGHEGSVRGGDATKSKLWNGAWFDCAGTVHVYSMTARAFNDCVIVNGGLAGTNGAKADWMMVNARILQGKVGLRIAGAFGGISTLGTSFQHNDINCRIDNTITAEVNREIFFGSNTWFDTNNDVSVEIDDTFSSGSAFIQFDNCWIGGNQVGGRGNGIYINPTSASSVLVNGGRIWLNRNSGIKNDSLTATLIVSNAQIWQNGVGVANTYGVENIVGNTASSVRACHFFSNGLTAVASFNTGITQASEFGASNEFRVRERFRAFGPTQNSNSIDTSGVLGGSILLQDNGSAGSGGGAALFGNVAGFWGAIRGQAVSSSGNTQGHVVISTRRATADATLTETARIRDDGNLVMRQGVVVGAGAATQSFIKASATADLGVYYGTGDPTFSAAKGSLYTKTDATTTTTRLWINTNGSTTWANFTSSA